MELRDFFRNSIGLGIFGVRKGDYTHAKICFTTDDAAKPVELDLAIIPAYPSLLEMQSACKSFSVKDSDTLSIVKPTLDYLEQELKAVTGVIKVKVTLVSIKDPTRDPKEFEADSTSWKWPSYYIE